MKARFLAAVPLLATAAASHADTGGTIDGATLSGMLLLGVLSAALLRAGLKEWRRETGKAEPVRMKSRSRRYLQP